MTDKKSNNNTMVRIKKTTKAIAEKNAQKQNRSTANYIETLILKDK